MKKSIIRSRSDRRTIAHSCQQPPEIRRLQAWCCIAGRFRMTDHHQSKRTIQEMILIYCSAGSGWLEVDGYRHRIGAGDVFFCPANHPHSYGCDTGTGWEVWWVHFLGTHADSLCRAAGLTARAPVLHAGTQCGLNKNFSRLLEYLSRSDPDTPWKAATQLHTILAALVRISAGTHRVRLASLIDAKISNLDELAARSGYSKYHFCRLFKQETGRAPWQAVLECKLERARELLLGSRLLIKEISAELGFPNADYFARCFTKYTGVSPGEYRGRKTGNHRKPAAPPR